MTAVQGGVAVERRRGRRVAVGALPWPLWCRVLPGREASVVDLGGTGILLRTLGVLRPGRPVRFHLGRDQGECHTLTGEVKWCLVVGVEPERGVVVHAGIAFGPELEWWRDLDRPM